MRKEEERFVDSTIMEGMVSFRAVVSAIRDGSSDRKIEKVLIDSERVKKISKHLSYIKAMSSLLSFEIEYTDKDVIDSVSTGQSHGGIITVCTERSIPELTEEHLCGKKGFFVLLSGIEDPYNFGYALRSLYAAGVDGIILDKRNWLSAAGVVCRASAGASELIPSYVSESDENTVNIFKKAGYRIVSAQLENSSPVWESDLSRPLLLAVGGEKRGLTKPIVEASDEIVRIDYGRDFPEALSAASASAILAFEVLRKNSLKITK